MADASGLSSRNSEGIKPTVIKSFPGQAVEEYRRTHGGTLPGEETRWLENLITAIKASGWPKITEVELDDLHALALKGLAVSEQQQPNPYKEAWKEWRSLQTGDVQKMMDDALRYRFLRTNYSRHIIEICCGTFNGQTIEEAEVRLDRSIARSTPDEPSQGEKNEGS